VPPKLLKNSNAELILRILTVYSHYIDAQVMGLSGPLNLVGYHALLSQHGW
jgi:hypothetical protein